MANHLETFGLSTYRKPDGRPLVGAQNRYKIANGYATAIYQGDLVRPLTDGTVVRHVGNTSYAVIGVFNGCFYNDPTTQKPTYSNYYPGGITPTQGQITAFVVDDPDAVFLVNADEVFAQANLFGNYSLSVANGSTTTGISEMQLDVSTQGTAGTFAVQAIDISQDPENDDQTTSNANVLVRINNHFYRQGGTGL